MTFMPCAGQVILHKNKETGYEAQLDYVVYIDLSSSNIGGG